MTLTQIKQNEGRLFSFGEYLKDKEKWGEMLTTRETTSLEDLLEPWRLQ